MSSKISMWELVFLLIVRTMKNGEISACEFSEEELEIWKRLVREASEKGDRGRMVNKAEAIKELEEDRRQCIEDFKKGLCGDWCIRLVDAELELLKMKT